MKKKSLIILPIIIILTLIIIFTVSVNIKNKKKFSKLEFIKKQENQIQSNNAEVEIIIEGGSSDFYSEITFKKHEENKFLKKYREIVEMIEEKNPYLFVFKYYVNNEDDDEIIEVDEKKLIEQYVPQFKNFEEYDEYLDKLYTE